MNKFIIYTDKHMHGIAIFLSLFLTVFATSCKTSREFESISDFHSDTVYVSREYHDTLSIYTRDSVSVFVNQYLKGDTVFLEKEVVKWKDSGIYNARAAADTVYRTKVDTLYLDRWVETVQPDSGTFKTGFRVGIAVVILLGILVYIGYRAIKCL